MTVSLLLLCVLSQFCLMTGQLLLKHAMNETNRTPIPWRKVVGRFSLGIVSFCGWFFLWSGLLQRVDLSYIYPFEGISPVLILIGAWFFLREKITLQSCIGIGLIGMGIALISGS